MVKQYYSIRFLANVWLWAESPSNENRELTEDEMTRWVDLLDEGSYKYCIYRITETTGTESKAVQQELVGGRMND